MKKAIIGIGIPGSGKTTLLKNFALNNGYEYINPDDIREELIGNARDQSRNREIWDEAYLRLTTALQEGKTVVFDATHSGPELRQLIIKKCHESGVEKIQGVYLDVSLEIAKERNSNREKVVPWNVMERMYEKLQKFPPELSEGMDSIFVFNEMGELAEVEKKSVGEDLSKEFKFL